MASGNGAMRPGDGSELGMIRLSDSVVSEIDDGDSRQADDQGARRGCAPDRGFCRRATGRIRSRSARTGISADAVAMLPKRRRQGRRSAERGPPPTRACAAMTTTAISGRILISTVTKLSSPAALIPRRFTQRDDDDEARRTWRRDGPQGRERRCRGAAAVASATAGTPIHDEFQVDPGHEEAGRGPSSCST